MCETEGVACARIRAKATNVKSFLRVCTKLFLIRQVFCASAKSTFYPETGPGADYTRSAAICQVFLRGFVQFNLIAQVLRRGR